MSYVIAMAIVAALGFIGYQGVRIADALNNIALSLQFEKADKEGS